MRDRIIDRLLTYSVVALIVWPVVLLALFLMTGWLGDVGDLSIDVRAGYSSPAFESYPPEVQARLRGQYATTVAERRLLIQKMIGVGIGSFVALVVVPAETIAYLVGRKRRRTIHQLC